MSGSLRPVGVRWSSSRRPLRTSSRGESGYRGLIDRASAGRGRASWVRGRNSTVYCRALGLALLSLVHLLSGSDAVSRRRWFAMRFVSGQPFHLERRFSGDDLFFLVQLVE